MLLCIMLLRLRIFIETGSTGLKDRPGICHLVALYYRREAVDHRRPLIHNDSVAQLAAPAGRGLFSKSCPNWISNRQHRHHALSRAAVVPAARLGLPGHAASVLAVLFAALSLILLPFLLSSAAARDRAALVAASGGSADIPRFALAPWTGAALPPFALDDHLSGAVRHSAALAGRVVLVHFFATWCEPCVPELASLQRLAHASRDEPLAIVAIDVGEVDLRVRAFFKRRPVDFPVLLDRDRSVAKAWNVTALPTTFVLDAAFQPRLFVEGDLDWSRPDIVSAIAALYPKQFRNDAPASGRSTSPTTGGQNGPT